MRGLSETKFQLLRPSPKLEFTESQFRGHVLDKNVTISRPSPKPEFSESQLCDKARLEPNGTLTPSNPGSGRGWLSRGPALSAPTLLQSQ